MSIWADQQIRELNAKIKALEERILRIETRGPAEHEIELKIPEFKRGPGRPRREA